MVRSWALPVLLLAAGCSRETSILLTVRGDLATGSDFDGIEVALFDEGAQLSSASYGLAAEDALPQRYTINLPEGYGAVLELSATATREGQRVLAATRTVSFVPGERIEVQLCLWRQCLDSEDPACLEGRCDPPAAVGDGDADADGDSAGDADGEPAGDADGEPAGDADAEAEADAGGGCTPPAVVESCAGSWCAIPAGCFTMGSPLDELGHVANESQHEVALTGDFEIMSTEVTQAEFEASMGYNPSTFTFCGSDCPVEMVSWHEAAAYCNALSDGAGLGRCYDCAGDGASVTCSPAAAHASPHDCPGYRLPTEAEWEYAARAGTTTATYNGDLDGSRCTLSAVLGPIAWYCGNSGDTTHPVGGLAANGWGLHDMLGNVYEWSHDWRVADLGSAAATDPFGPATGSERVVRGGSWGNTADGARAAHRLWNAPDLRHYNVGLRPVRSLEP